MAFRRRSSSSKITVHPTYSVTYLGSLFLSNETEAKNSQANINAIVDDANLKIRDLKKMVLKITESELILIDPKLKAECSFAAERIYRCSAVSGKDGVFAFVYRMAKGSSQFECHAVFCGGNDKAAEIASLLRISFKHSEFAAKSRQRKLSTDV